MGSENLLWAVKNGDLEACKIAAKEVSLKNKKDRYRGRVGSAFDVRSCHVLPRLGEPLIMRTATCGYIISKSIVSIQCL